MPTYTNAYMVCNNCSQPTTRLYQSYVDGSWNDGFCALKTDPYLTQPQRQAIERRLKKQVQARTNFAPRPAAAMLF